MFKIGQMVRLNRSFRDGNAARGAYQVVRSLPASDDGEFRYRLKSASENHERVARESELERA
jgi:hypothetical protein